MTHSDVIEPNPAARWGDRQRWLSITGVFLIAFLFRYVLVTRMPRALSTDLFWNDQTGWNLAEGHGFTASLTGYVPAVFRTPGYPAFLAIIYKLFGHSIHAALVGNAVLDSLTAVLVLLIGWRLLGPVVGCVAGLFYALYPYPAIFCTVLHQDMLLTLTVVLTLYLTLRAQSEPNRFGRWLLVGVMIGVTAWVKPFLALYGIVPAIVVLFCTELTVPKRLRAIVAMAVVSTFVISPWVARNYHEFHRIPLLAVGGTGDGMEALVAEVKGGEEGAFSPTGVDGFNRELNLSNVMEGQELIDWEGARRKVYGPQLREMWPGVLRVAVLHIPRLWITRRAEGYSRLVSLVAPVIGAAVLLFGVLGMYFLHKRWRSLIAIYATVAVITLLYAAIPIEARYTLPARPAMILFVAAALTYIYQRMGQAGVRLGARQSRASSR